MRNRRWIGLPAALLLLLPSALAAATWEIDPAHSTVGFTIRHLGISKVNGSFTGFSGTIEFEEKTPASGSAVVSVDAGTIDTRNADRDEHLRGPEFFDVANHPKIEFKSTAVSGVEGAWVLEGRLTILGVERSVKIPFHYLGSARDPWGGTRAAFEGTVTITREEFGIGWKNVKFRPPLIGNEVRITLDLETVRKE